jgi:hypothetical protein
VKTPIIGQNPEPAARPEPQEHATPTPGDATPQPREIGGRGGLDPVRYGDWEKNGRCIDF